MAYLIRTKDGRTTIGTARAEAAARHIEELRQLGAEVETLDINGERFEVADLFKRANLMRIVEASLKASAEAV